MEYREPPRIAATEGRLDGVIDAQDSSRRFRRFDFVRAERQLDLPRVVLAATLGLAALGAVGYLATQAVRAAVRWLHLQPQYQIRFQDITLREPPPPWLRGGSETLLKKVRENAREPETLSVMDLGPGRIERAFKLYPWIDDVLRVEYPPQGIVVRIAYKQPVAVIPFPGAEQVILDRNGHVLPREDLDMDRLGPLIRITGRGLVASSENRPGTAWRPGTATAEALRIEGCVQRASRLAGFLLEPERSQQMASTPALRVIAIVATDPRGFFLQTADDAMIHWADAPGDEPAGSPTAREKWAMLENWAKGSTRQKLAPGDFWTFERHELRPVETGRGH